MKKKDYVFVGCRDVVMQKMLDLGLNIKLIMVVENSPAQRLCERKNIDFEIIKDKKSLIEILKNFEYDILISNGLPYILPITDLQKGNSKKFINIHPSLLPDLRGKHPVNGAILYKKCAGVTCHYMNDNIDDGDIISQIPIEYSEDLDAGLLYQLSFYAEGEVFVQALKNDFHPILKQKTRPTDVYVSFNEDDLKVDIEKTTIEDLILRVKAFNTPSKMVKVTINGANYNLTDIQVLQNKYLYSLINNYKNLEVAFKYDNNIILKKDNKFLKLTFKED